MNSVCVISAISGQVEALSELLGKMRKTGRAANLISGGKRDKRAQHPRGTEQLCSGVSSLGVQRWHQGEGAEGFAALG